MKSVIPIIIILPIFLQALTTHTPLRNPILYEEQRKIYDAQHKERKLSQSIYTELQVIPVEEDVNASKACLRIDIITLENAELIDDDELDTVIKPYLHRCDSMEDINIIVKNINNIYFEKAYVTSSAYIKAQDMSKHKLIISTMEGKIEKVEGKDISTSLVFPYVEQSHLNLRDLEIGLEQLNRLQSVQATMQINPGKEEGSSTILITGKKTSSVIHGNLGVNNYGTEKSGRYQISGSLGWDNPLGLNDLLSINLNTTDKQDNENNSIGNSIAYGFPVGRAYLEISYAKFDYDQIVNGLNVDYLSSGATETFQIKSEYKLFHNKTQKGKFDISLLRKKNDNYLADVFLETSSNKLTIFQLSYTHHFSAATWDGYATLRYNRGLEWFAAKTGSSADPTFNKVTLDLSYNKRIHSAGLPAFYNFSFYGQYAKEGIVGSEQIGIGGPYSVRGFTSESQISGNKGFYIRNELALHQQFTKATMSPYFALDYGVVSDNEESYGGHMVGLTFGVRFNFYDCFLYLSHSLPMIDSNKITYSPNGDEIRKENNPFSGFSLSYRF